MGRAAGSDGENVPALQRAVRPDKANVAKSALAARLLALQIAIRGLRLVARARNESESILDCFDARFRPQRTCFHL